MAGGIGINPIVSMLLEAKRHQKELKRLETMSLLYSARSEDELAYRTEVSLYICFAIRIIRRCKST